MKMKNWVLALLFLSIGQISVVMAPTQAAILVTSKPQYAIGEVVYFALTNTSTVPIGDTCVDPWTIYKDVDGKWEHVYAPPREEGEGWTIYPTRCKMWRWEQESSTTVTADAGTYKVEISLTDVGTWSATFTIEGKASPSSMVTLVTSKPQYAIGEVVYFTLINTSTVPIGETYGDPWTIYKDVDGKWEHVYAPPYRRVDWTMNHGECRTWKWDSFFEKDMHSTVTVDAGTYKVVMDITHAGTSSATFTLEEPASFSAFYSLFYYFLFSVALGFVLIYISARVIKIEDVTVQKTLGVTLISAVCSTAFLIIHPWGNLVGFALVLPAVKVIYKTTWEKALAVFVVYGAVQLVLVLISMGVITLF